MVNLRKVKVLTDWRERFQTRFLSLFRRLLLCSYILYSIICLEYQSTTKYIKRDQFMHFMFIITLCRKVFTSLSSLQSQQLCGQMYE